MLEKNTIWFDEYNEHGDYEKATRALKKSEPDFIIRWHKTDAWRGYFEAKARKDSGWRKVDEINGEKLAGWCTGEWSDAPHGTRGSELEKLLSKLDATEAKIIFLPTSNFINYALENKNAMTYDNVMFTLMHDIRGLSDKKDKFFLARTDGYCKRCKICGEPLYGVVRVHHHNEDGKTAD